MSADHSNLLHYPSYYPLSCSFSSSTLFQRHVKHTRLLSLFVCSSSRLVRRHKNDSKWKLFILPKIFFCSRFSHFISFHFLCRSPLCPRPPPNSSRRLCCGNKNITFPSCFVSLMLLTLSLLYFAISRGKRRQRALLSFRGLLFHD